MLMAAATIGCGAADDLNRGSIAGKVTLDGVPLEAGTVCFNPTEGTTGPASYATIAQGKYSISAKARGPLVGKHKVVIDAYRDIGNKTSSGEPLKEQVVPAKYNQQTTLVVAVTQGPNTQDFELVSK
jgi:hypothetical protein